VSFLKKIIIRNTKKKLLRVKYDIAPTEVLWNTLWKKCIRVAYVKAIKDMYEEVPTSVRTQGGDTKDFFIIIGLQTRFNTKSLYYHHNFGCRYLTHPRVRTKMHSFCI